MIETSPHVDLDGPGYRAMAAFSRATHELPLDPLLRELIRVRASGNPLPDAVLAEAEAGLCKDGLAAATWIAITINAWNRVAIAGHERAGEYEPAAAA